MMAVVTVDQAIVLPASLGRDRARECGELQGSMRPWTAALDLLDEFLARTGLHDPRSPEVRSARSTPESPVPRPADPECAVRVQADALRSRRLSRDEVDRLPRALMADFGRDRRPGLLTSRRLEKGPATAATRGVAAGTS